MKRSRLRVPARRVAGFLWLVLWVLVLYLVAAPWRSLGGLVDERLRWLEWFVLLVGLSVGFTLGRFGRDLTGPGTGRTHLGFLRLVLYPLAGLTAVCLVALALLEQRDPSGVVLTAFLAYWAGLDLACGAVPLMEGKPFRWVRPLDPEPSSVARENEQGAWVPPWERI